MISILRRSLGKIPSNVLHDELREWNALPDDFIVNLAKSSKSYAIDEIVREAQSRSSITEYDILRLDLQTLIKFSRGVMWNTFLLDNSNIENQQVDKLQRSIESVDELRKKAISYVMESKDKLLWISLLFRREKKLFYAVCHRKCDAILVHGGKESLLSQMLKGLRIIFRSTTIKKIALSGKCPRSLLQIRLNKLNTSLNILPERSNQAPPEEEQDESFIYDQNPKKEKLFTKENENVILNEVTYEISQPKTETNDEMFCKISFKGNNVLAGLRELQEQGILTEPIPEPIDRLPQLGRNTIKLRF
ncbi:DgyrCDS9974 [Dimorphilus gyrociliatus]|uniref:DgyrCDS9974 n=1 Tax=Dimorphilus gyrociliatus TaxID=2664684 RepID=A0A7I8VZ24_9ANNE|nr:DgyrCDS9974 [Dimorphilus gyrociliatus]